ncbi:MAG: M48 family metallopeptidase [Burkholderiaceae bacterium]|nr:M48 family metallopeptidase [Burkholderiaceae bacterium]
MSDPFRTDVQIPLPPLASHGDDCRCVLHARRRLGGAVLGAGLFGGLGLSGTAQAQADAECSVSAFTKAVSAEQVEQAAGQQYRQMLQQAAAQKGVAPMEHPQLKRLRYIANRIVPLSFDCNPRARNWRWEVNLLGSDDLNAFCMPGGKIAFYFGILKKLQLDDDEVAVIMGHEVAHALLEHARERMGKTMATRGAIEIGAALLGLGDLGRTAANMGGQLLTLRFSRSDESQADALGLVLSAKAGYRPDAGASLWRKMLSASKGAPPAWLSTHPSGEERIREIEARYARVDPLYAAAAKPDQRFAPPKA